MIILILNLYFLLQLLIGVIKMTDAEKLEKVREKIRELLSFTEHNMNKLEDDADHDANGNSKFYKRREADVYRNFFYDLCRLQDIVR